MILHSIKKHVDFSHTYKPHVTNTLPVVHVKLYADPLKAKHKYDKLGYAQFLNRTNINIGDYLVAKSANFPFEDKDIVKVTQIQEIHWMASANEVTGEPMSLFVCNINKVSYWTCPSFYVKWAGDTEGFKGKFE